MAGVFASRTMVGRVAEFAALAGPLEAAAAGRSSMALVTGTSGVGVSRFLSEAASRVGDLPTPFRVAAARPRPGRAADPYEPILSALEPVLASLSDVELARVAEHGGDVLARLLPSLAGRLTALGVLSDRAWSVAPERRQSRVFEALLGTLERLATGRPVLLVLEDLHRVDAATRAFVTFLARITRPGRWCLLTSFQPDELTRDHPLRADLTAIAEAARPALRIDLGPLARGEIAELIAGIEGSRPSAGSLLLVWERSRGNPFLAEELVAARHELSGIDLAGPAEAVIAARLARRSPEARRILRLIAPAGEGLRLEHVAAASAAFEVGAERPSPRSATEPRRGDGGLDGDLRAGLAEAIEHGFVVLRHADGGPASPTDGLAPDDIVATRHERIGRAVVADLLPTQRRRYHAALAVALDAHPEAATRQWLLARVQAEARSAALRAAEHAGGLDAPEDALDRLELAIELGADAGGKREARTGAALLALAGELAYAAGHASRAAAYAETAIARLDEKSDRLAVAAEQVRLGRALRLGGDLDGSLVALRRAVELVPRAPSVERARVLATLAQSLMLDGHFAESERLATEAIRTARATGEAGRGVEAHATTSLGMARAWGADPAEAPGLLEAAARLADEAGDLDERFRATNNRITALHLLGRRAESIGLALAGIEEARRHGLETVYGNYLRGNVAEVLFAVGRWEEAAEMARTALEWSPAGPAFVEPAVFLAAVRIEQHADEEAAALLGRLLLQLELFPDPQYVIPASRAAASFALWRGDVADATRAIALGWEIVRRTEDWIQVAATAAMVLEVCAASAADARERRDLAAVADARDRGGRVLAEAERIVRGVGPTTSSGAAAPEAVAWLAAARADHARANDRDEPATWRAVAGAWERVGNPYQVARARWREAQAILESADDARVGRAKARAPLLEAVRLARELGARPLIRELLALATRALIRVPDAQGDAAAIESAPTGTARVGSVGVPVGPGRPAADSDAATGSIAAALIGPSQPAPRDTFGLSNREREVLGLIVEGRTNREIGERLFISQKTVGVHVGNILAKLGVSGRVEAATVALRLGLTVKG